MFTKAHARGELKVGETLADVGEINPLIGPDSGRVVYVKVFVPNDAGVRLIGRKWVVLGRSDSGLDKPFEFLPPEKLKEAMGRDLIGFFLAKAYRNGKLEIHTRVKHQEW